MLPSRHSKVSTSYRKLLVPITAAAITTVASLIFVREWHEHSRDNQLCQDAEASISRYRQRRRLPPTIQGVVSDEKSQESASETLVLEPKKDFPFNKFKESSVDLSEVTQVSDAELSRQMQDTPALSLSRDSNKSLDEEKSLDEDEAADLGLVRAMVPDDLLEADSQRLIDEDESVKKDDGNSSQKRHICDDFLSFWDPEEWDFWIHFICGGSCYFLAWIMLGLFWGNGLCAESGSTIVFLSVCCAFSLFALIPSKPLGGSARRAKASLFSSSIFVGTYAVVAFDNFHWSAKQDEAGELIGGLEHFDAITSGFAAAIFVLFVFFMYTDKRMNVNQFRQVVWAGLLSAAILGGLTGSMVGFGQEFVEVGVTEDSICHVGFALCALGILFVVLGLGSVFLWCGHRYEKARACDYPIDAEDI